MEQRVLTQRSTTANAFCSQSHSLSSGVTMMSNELESFLDCALCLKPLFQPVTTTCGHSYCKACLTDALQYKKICPLCRAACFISPDHPINVTLSRIVESFYPDVYEQRLVELKQDCKEKKLQVPLFVEEMVHFPFAPLSLHLYESRYRLLAQRCNDAGCRVFGVVYLERSSSVANLVGSAGCLVEISLAHETPDGRWFIHAKGTRRFRVEKIVEEPGTDGLIYATVHDLDAEYDVDELSRHRLSKAVQLRDSNNLGSSGGNSDIHGSEVPPQDVDREHDILCLRLRVLLEDYMNATIWSKLNIFSALIGPSQRMKNLPESPLKFSYWLAGFLPVPLQQKQKLLEAPTLYERLSLEVEMFKEIVDREAIQTSRFLFFLISIIVTLTGIYLFKILFSLL